MNTSLKGNSGIYTAYMDKKYTREGEFNQEDKENVEKIAKQLGPLKSSVKVSCNIPVCGHQEQKNIYRCLSCFARQKPETYDAFEVNLLVNSPVPTADNVYCWEETKSEIERFKTEHPEIIVNVAYFRFSGEFDIGIIRSYLNDARMLDVSDPKKHLFASYDADMVDMPREYMERLPRLFQKPEHQLMVARIKDSDDMLCYFPAHRIAGLFRQLLGGKVRKPSGSNMVFRVSVYEQSGGYQKTHGKLGEDGALGWAIRKNNPDGVRQGNSAVTITSNARRKIYKLLDNNGQKPQHGFWRSKSSDGSVIKDAFGAEEKYRELEYVEDVKLLKHITSDENAWKKFLKDLASEIKTTLADFFANQIKFGILKQKVDKTSNIPKKWNGAMRILGIEKWDIKVDLSGNQNKVPSIDLDILEAEGLKEKLKRFITDKEKVIVNEVI